MCRYAGKHYKRHFACFVCRKAFKRRNKADVDPDGDDRPARCPQCGLLMADMGLDFAPPKVDDERAWLAGARLYEVGETFHSCGCSGPGYRPRDSASLAKFFAERRELYLSNLEQWLRSTPDTDTRAKERDDAIRTWRSRVERLERAAQGSSASPPAKKR